MCTDLYTGDKCDGCKLDSFGYPNCTPCNCSTPGSRYEYCDYETGKCDCNIYFEGDKCDKCELDSFGYPNCEPCNCSPSGSHSQNCNKQNGHCNCNSKMKFIGRQCKSKY